MIDLSTTYLGLRLAHPLVASASPLSYSLDGIRSLEDGGAAAIVMHSLFEEQIEEEAELLDHYYAHLVTALVEFGAAEDRKTAAGLLTRESLQDQYEVAILDMCRWPQKYAEVLL